MFAHSCFQLINVYIYMSYYDFSYVNRGRGNSIEYKSAKNSFSYSR